MEFQTLTLNNLIKAKAGNIISHFLKNDYEVDSNLPNYEFIKDITPAYTNKKNRVAIYEDKKGNKVVAKRVLYKTVTMDSLYLQNEARILKTLKKNNFKHNICPEYKDFIIKNNESILITEYFDGIGLDKNNSKTRIDNVLKAFLNLRKASEVLKKSEFKNLPKRKPFFYLVSFPINWLRVIINNYSKAGKFLKYGLIFYRNYMQIIFGKFDYGLVHRDIYPDNILYSKAKNEFRIIDWESTTVSDNLYDLAQIAMIYSNEFDDEYFINLLKEYLINDSQKRRFIGLSIFNGIQILAYHKPNELVYKDTENFLNYLICSIYPNLIYKKSPFEVINSATLNFINLFYKLTKLPKYTTKKKLVLCYHSIGNYDWRYSVKPNNFKKQIKFLKKYYKIKSLSNLIAENQGGIAISFDDGYRDVLQNAAPLLAEKKIKPTMFVIGKYKNANRKELDNNMEIVNYEEIIKLHRLGWEIGYHTTTHANLGTINELDLENEIVKGRRELEGRLGFPIQYFAYPKGIYSDKIIKYIKKADYVAAFTTDGYPVRKSSDREKFSRISIEKELTIDQFEALLSPIGLYVSEIFVNILKFKAKYF